MPHTPALSHTGETCAGDTARKHKGPAMRMRRGASSDSMRSDRAADRFNGSLSLPHSIHDVTIA
jgi:hypothetical protein